MGITVAVTGPTGEIGTSVVGAFERDGRVERIVGMARRPFDPAVRGWAKTEYRQGNVLDRDMVERLAAECDVLVHLAFVVLGSRDEAGAVNLEGSRNVFEAASRSRRTTRLVYTSSVAAYGYHPDNPVPLTEDVPARGSSAHYYSRQKAACEEILGEITGVGKYVLRPCIVAGPDATILARSLPWNWIGERLPEPVRRLAGSVPLARPVLPDPGVPFQLIHHDDMASAVVAAALGDGPPGTYNLAGDGVVTVSDVARAMGAVAIPVPHILARLAAETAARVPLLPSEVEWLQAIRHPMIVDTAKARRELGWKPEYTGLQTLKALAESYRD